MEGCAMFDNQIRTGWISCGQTLLLVILLHWFSLAVGQTEVADIEEPDGYRMAKYNAPVPAGLDGAKTIAALGVKRLQQSAGAAVVDVLPYHKQPANLPENQIWSPPDHIGIPGAIWLPETGRGVLSDVTEDYFKHHLNLVTGGNLDHPLVIYCRASCWMSWNAAKRALSYGYVQVFWFPGGIDDWLAEDYASEVLSPAQGQR